MLKFNYANCYKCVSIFTMLENEKESPSHFLCELVLIFPIKFIILFIKGSQLTIGVGVTKIQ